MKKYILLLSVLIALTSTASAVNITNPGTLSGPTTFTVHDGEVLNIYENESLLLDMSDLVIEEGGTVYNWGDVGIQTGSIQNHGRFENMGTVVVGDLAGFFNYGTVNTSNLFWVFGYGFTNNGTFTNTGRTEISYSVDFINNGAFVNYDDADFLSILYNYGIIHNYGVIKNRDWAPVYNYGRFVNYPGSAYTDSGSGYSEWMELQVYGNPMEYPGNNSNEIPEFPTIALPLMAIIGLAFMVQRKKE